MSRPHDTSEAAAPAMTLARLVESLPPRPDASGLVAGFTPPPRFQPKSFDDYTPANPSQERAVRRLRQLPRELDKAGSPTAGGLLRRIWPFVRGAQAPSIYLDGGFGVGKTHLLAALWRSSPAPKAFLSFDELMYFVGLFGVGKAAAVVSEHRLIAVDEWELDDPGNLKMALAWLRRVLASGARLAVTSNTLPLELGEGRFSQKDFTREIEELAGAFEVIRIEGEDYRHRRFEAHPGRGYFVTPDRLETAVERLGSGVVHADFAAALETLAAVHPIRYADIAAAARQMVIRDIEQIDELPAALRWVHFVDSLYDAAVPLLASSRIALADLFPPEFVEGSYGKKMSRCLSRLEEMLGESATETAARVDEIAVDPGS